MTDPASTPPIAPRPTWHRRLSSARRALVGSSPPRPLLDAIRQRHPPFVEAVLADARITASFRHEPFDPGSSLDAVLQMVRLAVVSDAFFGLCCYRAEARARTHGIPLLPHVLHRLSMMTAQICIGPPALIQPGIYVPHGQIVVDGFTEVGRGVVLSPFVTLGLVSDEPRGPTIGRGVRIGTGAKVVGPVTVEESAVVGANSVVVTDVAAGVTVVGAPARPVGGAVSGPDAGSRSG
jgi:serine O-acetyltransferase